MSRHTQGYEGTRQGRDDEVYKIKIINQHSEIETSINLIIEDNGEQREVNIKRTSHPITSQLQNLIEKAKADIKLITILKNLNL